MDIQAFRDRITDATAAHTPRAETVAAIDDENVAGSYGGIPVRLYRPAGTDGGPALLYLHGAGWIGGSVASHDIIARKLANDLGAVVASVDYRLAPEFPYPAALEESYAVLAWLRAHAERLRIDPRRIAVAGDSAGGNLAAALALLARDRKGPAVQAQVLINPVVDLRQFSPDGACQQGPVVAEFVPMMTFFRDRYLAGADVTAAYASPLLAAELTDLPAVLVVTGGLDPLCGQGEAYAQRLRAAGVETELYRQNDIGHFGVLWAVADPVIAPSLAATVAFLRRVLWFSPPR